MGPETPQRTIEDLSRELVALTRTLRANERRSAELKEQIASVWQGVPIECEGGRVMLVEAGELTRLDQTTLLQLIFERSMLPRSDAEALVRDSKVPAARAAYVAVRLNEGAA